MAPRVRAARGSLVVNGDRSEDPAGATRPGRDASVIGRADQANAHTQTSPDCPANCPCRLLAPTARAQSTASLEATLAASAERDPARLAWALARFRMARRLDPAGLAAWLGLREAELPRLALCRRP